MFVQPVVHDGPANAVVIVSELRERFDVDKLFAGQHSVKVLEIRESLLFSLDGPVVSGRHPQRARGSQCRDINVPVINAQIGCVLTEATALHRGGHHNRWEEHGRPIVDCAQEEDLGSATAVSFHGDSRDVNIRQSLG